ncbi:hypothetical protein SKAU_G00179970 [Synaphobranchus kaupii]|uniref:Uncharacterized protein n=1 Tax=Synaphobranchus kaupii TaxID=118154 RepID=A0A9Q1J1P0_SYNKA|nr:hypothetical protein SKAU_G00179970 [Synaphobranchus kaupii]
MSSQRKGICLLSSKVSFHASCSPVKEHTTKQIPRSALHLPESCFVLRLGGNAGWRWLWNSGPISENKENRDTCNGIKANDFWFSEHSRNVWKDKAALLAGRNRAAPESRDCESSVPSYATKSLLAAGFSSACTFSQITGGIQAAHVIEAVYKYCKQFIRH